MREIPTPKNLSYFQFLLLFLSYFTTNYEDRSISIRVSNESASFFLLILLGFFMLFLF